MYRKVIVGILLCLSGYASAHEWTPTYPKLIPSFVDGISVVKMSLFNKRKDINHYEVSVWTEDWEQIRSSTGGGKLIRVSHLQRKNVDVYIRNKDKGRAVYVCSRSKSIVDGDKATFLSSRICSKIK